MLTISPEDALELPVDELAMLVLADLATFHELDEYNYGNTLRQDVAHGYAGNRDARRAVSEAVAWLHAHGMVARVMEDHSGNGSSSPAGAMRHSPDAFLRSGLWTESRTIFTR
jgi:hypothetical protein